MTEAELEMMRLGARGSIFMIDKRDVTSLAIGFGLVAMGLIEVVGEHIPDDLPETFWLAKLTQEGGHGVLVAQAGQRRSAWWIATFRLINPSKLGQ